MCALQTPSEVQHSTHELDTLSQSEVRDESKESVGMESRVCAPAKGLEKVFLKATNFYL